MTEPPRLKWRFQFHLSTAIVLMFVSYPGGVQEISRGFRAQRDTPGPASRRRRTLEGFRIISPHGREFSCTPAGVLVACVRVSGGVALARETPG